MSRVPISLLKNWKRLPQLNFVRTNVKDVGVIKSQGNHDLLLQSLKTAKTASNVLEIVSLHSDIMNSKHLMQALRSLFTFQKYEGKNLSTNDIINHPHFHTLCQRLKTQSRAIELNDTIEALKVISYVGVSSKSTITQVLLQLVRHNINDLSLQNIIFLDFLLKRFENSPLVDALLMALPIVFEVHLNTKMDRENISQLSDYLHFISKKNNMSDYCLKTITDALVEVSDDLNTKIATSIIRSLCDIRPNECTEILLKIVLHYLTKNIYKLTHNDIDIITSQLVGRIQPFGNLNYYNERFFTACIKRVIDEDKGFEDTLWILKKTSKISHFNPQLLDYISEKCVENPKLISEAKPQVVSILVGSIAMSDYKPKFWDSLKTAIIQNDVINCEVDQLFWALYVTSLAALDIYIPKLIEKLFNLDFLENLIRKKYLSDYENLLLLYQAIATLKPEYAHYLPPEWFMDKIKQNINKHANSDFPLEGALEKALGGSEYLRTNMNSLLGHVIDHVVIMKNDGSPVEFKSDNMSTNIENLQVPDDAQIVLILALSPKNYAINCDRMNGKTALYLRTLERKNYVVVPINLKQWMYLKDYEKIPYISQAINEKLEESQKTYILR